MIDPLETADINQRHMLASTRLHIIRAWTPPTEDRKVGSLFFTRSFGDTEKLEMDTWVKLLIEDNAIIVHEIHDDHGSLIERREY